MDHISFTQVKARYEFDLYEQYIKFEVFSYLIEDRGVDVVHLKNLRKDMQISIEEFAELCDKALTIEVRPYGSNENPHGLILKSDGNRRKPRMEVEQ